MLADDDDHPFDPLPIDNAAGLPQSFGYVRDGVRYTFTLTVSVPEHALGRIDEIMTLPQGREVEDQRFLVVRVDAFAADGSPQTVFLRKVVPSLRYRAGGLVLRFPKQVVACRNLNGTGSFGTEIVGEVASAEAASP